MYKKYFYLDKINLDVKIIQRIFTEKQKKGDLLTFKEPLEFEVYLKNIYADIKNTQEYKFRIIIALDFSCRDPLAPLKLLNKKYPLLIQKSLVIVLVEPFEQFDRKKALNFGVDLVYEKPWHYQELIKIFDDILKLT